ncbi:MAG: L-aspartate oxidase [Candidatus Gastranaerophilales bacterium]|nr:L-aspartate oxidase [Candidatus Gastranaerophilales bacterium]
MKSSEYSTIIAGSGIAGLYTALRLSEGNQGKQKILLVTKSNLSESNSRYAQGGIVGVMRENASDSVSLHVKDTLKAGAGLSDTSVVKFISENSEKVINDLLSHGVDFDRDEDDNLRFTMEGAHSARRILHAGGDATGLCIEKTLAEKVQSCSNIHILEETFIVELLVNSQNECKGVIAFNNITGEYETFYANAVVLATGGSGQLYKHTTNPSVTTGDGLAAAYRAGAVMQDMEFVQFHPTAFEAKTEENMFLISEAVRGEGAKLCYADGKTFMEKYDERLELASRDIVTRAIYNEMMTRGLSNVYLNATIIDRDKLNNRFPTILGICRKNGIEPEKDFIPVSPAAHYLMGGVKTTVTGLTSIKNLYAIGETSCTGLHGANRLASNSLLECVVSAYEITEKLQYKNCELPDFHIIEKDERIYKTLDIYKKELPLNTVDFKVLRQTLRNLMWDKVGIIRNENNLKQALTEIDEIAKTFGYTDKCPSKEAYELRNLLTVAKLVTEFAIRRKESRGGHYREDYPGKHEPARHYTKSINDNKYEEIYVK